MFRLASITPGDETVMQSRSSPLAKGLISDHIVSYNLEVWVFLTLMNEFECRLKCMACSPSRNLRLGHEYPVNVQIGIELSICLALLKLLVYLFPFLASELLSPFPSGEIPFVLRFAVLSLGTFEARLSIRLATKGSYLLGNPFSSINFITSLRTSLCFM